MIKTILSNGMNPDLESKLRSGLGSLVDIQTWPLDAAHDAPIAQLLVVDAESNLQESLDWIEAMQSKKTPIMYCLPDGDNGDRWRQSLVRLGAIRVLTRPIDHREMVRHISLFLGLRVPSVPIQRSLEVAAHQALSTPGTKVDSAALVLKLARAAHDLQTGNLSDDQRKQAAVDALRLTTEFHHDGFDQGVRHSRLLQLLFGQGSKLAPDHRQRILASVAKLTELVAIEHQLVPQAGPSSNRRTLLMVGRRGAPFPAIAEEAAARSFRTIMAESNALAEDLLAYETIDVLIVDLRTEDFRGVLRNQKARTIPVIGMLGSKFDWMIRAQIEASDRTRFAQATQNVSEMLDQVQEMEDQVRRLAPRILAVCADEYELSSVEKQLSGEKLRFFGLLEPRKFWESLESIVPDMVLVSTRLPVLSGVELCRAIRTDSEWAHLPVLFIGTSSEMEQVYRAGADDHCTGQGDELRIKVRNRLLRAQSFRQLSEVDSLTGLSTRRRCLAMLKQMLRMAGRRQERLSLVVLDIDHFKKVNDTYGHTIGDDVLRTVGHLLMRSFRTEDVVGRWGGEEFLIGLYSMGHELASNRLAHVLAQMRSTVFKSSDDTEFHVTISAGLAVFPNDGQDLPVLFQAADAALYQAKQNGRDRVVVYDSLNPIEDQKLDLVLIEDEDTKALSESFSRTGYKCTVYSPAQAREALSGLRPAVKTRVLVLNDLALLEEIKAATPGFPSTRVVFLSPPQTEDEILKGLDLGVFDQLTRPISFPVLIRKLERALGK